MPNEAMMKHIGWKLWWANRKTFLFPGLYVFFNNQNRRILPVLKRSLPPALVEFPEQTIVIAKNQKQYRPLPAYRYQGDPNGAIVCCWQLSWRDRLKLLATGKLWHQILTFNQPLQPQLMLTDKPDMPPHTTDPTNN